MKYIKNIITEAEPLSKEVIESFAGQRLICSTVKIERLLYLDNRVVDGAFYMEVLLCHEGTSEDSIENPHVHDTGEILAFIGTDYENPWSLNAEVDLWINDEKYTLNRSCLIFIPKGLKHCPVRFKRVEKPLWFMALSPMGTYARKVEKLGVTTGAGDPKYLKYIVTEMKKHSLSQPSRDLTSKTPKITRILYLDDEIVEGAFYMECIWFAEGFSDGGPPPHIHEFDEILGFLGSDPKNPRELNGEIELWIDDEKYTLNRSCLIFIPKGLKHCPLIFKRIDRPILHFSAGPVSRYKRAL